MNKTQLIEEIARKSGLSKAEAKKALEAFVLATTDALKNGDKVSIIGFGSFSISKRGARTGRHPQTGSKISIPEKKVVKFKLGANLADAVSFTDDTGPESNFI